ncbi:MAG: M48 family metallopeptidase [Desulfovibrio sp.]|nr:M48 family metallopeptidase [Desulfovibrio sp.]MBI4958196.1 M48 family metallopeptidase [Desulfovibrio sp.]
MITPESGLTVVTPQGFDPGLVPGIVRERLNWVNHHLDKAQAAREEATLAPATVELRAVGSLLTVRYRAKNCGANGLSPQTGGGVRVRSEGFSSLGVTGDIACRDSVTQALRTWLKREAGRLLPPLLEAEAARTNLTFSAVTIRLQRTRWGSCSAKGVISLNARLLFLPPELAGYVLAHELAHTVHLNHSGKFWSFLESIRPGAMELDRHLRTARRYVPAWARG